MLSISQGKFRKESPFDAKSVVFQIVALQIGYYCILGGLFSAICFIYSVPYHLSILFDCHFFDLVTLETLKNDVTPVIFILSALAAGCFGGYLLKVLVGRTLKCPDFTLTVFFIHIIITWIVSSSFPLSIYWWTLFTTSFFLLLLTSTWFCSREELLPIQLPTTLKQTI